MGKPSGSNVPLSRTESIGAGSETRGSETSQYPQEKKSTEIPQVVARRLNRPVYRAGLRDFDTARPVDSGSCWKAAA